MPNSNENLREIILPCTNTVGATHLVVVSSIMWMEARAVKNDTEIDQKAPPVVHTLGIAAKAGGKGASGPHERKVS
jgi:hypothetical protein